jgi:glycosyltransferase involved in cell wall biosynthesis
MNGGPTVSILINNYNYGRFLGEAIDSALTQTYPNFEVIVVDDGSTDNSHEVITAYGDRICAVLKENGGQASAFNTGFVAARGDIICFLDADDLFKPEKVEYVVRILEDNPSLGWCFDVVRQFDDRTGERYPWPTTHESGKWDVRAITAAGKPPLVPTATSGLSFRRETLARILPMPEYNNFTSDGYIKYTALAASEGWMASGEFTLLRIHGNNAYTRRVDGKKKRLGAQIELFTGISLYEQWPTLQRLALKLFSRGLGVHWASGGLEPSYKQRVRLFVRNLALPQRSEVLIRATIWSTVQRFGH